MKKYLLLSFCLLAFSLLAEAGSGKGKDRDSTTIFFGIEREEVLEKLQNMPNIEVGKGITFRSKNNSYEMTLKFRMQNMLGVYFDNNFKYTKMEAQVKRLRLRLDGYIFSPKFVYSIQLGFTGYDAKLTPNGSMNIVRDAIVYYKPNSSWNLGFGQTKIKTNRARINSSSALQFVDRSIVNSEFGGDRDFGIFAEYHHGDYDSFAVASFASITMGEGRNWGKSNASGLAYTGRVEIFPFGRLHAKGEYVEGDTYYEDKVKLMIGGGYSFNHNARLNQGFKGDPLPDNHTRNIGAYYADISLKYKGFALNADFMGRHANNPAPLASDEFFIYTGCGVNAQASYLFDKKWELAVRNSTLLPRQSDTGYDTSAFTGYDMWNQSTIGVTRYIIGHSLKVQLDVSYNYMTNAAGASLIPAYDRWGFRLQLELGL